MLNKEIKEFHTCRHRPGDHQLRSTKFKEGKVPHFQSRNAKNGFDFYFSLSSQGKWPEHQKAEERRKKNQRAYAWPASLQFPDVHTPRNHSSMPLTVLDSI